MGRGKKPGLSERSRDYILVKKIWMRWCSLNDSHKYSLLYLRLMPQLSPGVSREPDLLSLVLGVRPPSVPARLHDASSLRPAHAAAGTPLAGRGGGRGPGRLLGGPVVPVGRLGSSRLHRSGQLHLAPRQAG